MGEKNGHESNDRIDSQLGCQQERKGEVVGQMSRSSDVLEKDWLVLASAERYHGSDMLR